MFPRLSTILIIISLFGAIISIRLVDPAPVQKLRHATFDTLQSLYPRPSQTSSSVRIIDIDQETIDKIGAWPWPRTHITTLIKQLRKNNAAAIGLPFIFDAPDMLSPEQIIKRLPLNQLDNQTRFKLQNLPKNDQSLAQIIKKSPVIMGYMPLPSSKKGGALLASSQQLSVKPNPTHKHFATFSKVQQSLSLFTNNSSGIGALPFNTISTKSLQSIPILYRNGQDIHPSFSAEMLRIAQGVNRYGILGLEKNKLLRGLQPITGLKIGDLSLPIDSQGHLLLHVKKTDKSRYIPAWKILHNDTEHHEIDGRLTIISSSLPQIMPHINTALETDIPRAELLAQSLEQVLQKRSLQKLSYHHLIEFSLIILGGLAILFGLFYFGSRAAIILTAILIGLITAISYFLFKSGLMFDSVFPSLAWLLTLGLARFSYLIPTKQDKASLQKVFSQKISDQALAKITNNNTPPQLDGKYTDVPILSMQILGLNHLNIDQDNAVNITPSIQKLYQHNKSVIQNNGGFIDYLGSDQLCAFWDQPYKNANNVTSKTLSAICKTALTLSHKHDEILAALPLKNEKDSKEAPISSIVLTTGDNWVGDGGLNTEPHYSIFGQSRGDLIQLHIIACHYQARIVVTQAFAEQVKHVPFLPFPVPPHNCNGVGDFVYILLIGHQTNKNSKIFMTLEKLHFRLLESLKENNKKAASTLIDQCLPLAGTDLKTAYQQLRAYL